MYSQYFKTSDDQLQIIAVPNARNSLFNTDAWLEFLDVEKQLNNIEVEGKLVTGILWLYCLPIDFCSTLADGSCLHFSPFMYFDWNTENVRMTGDKINRICTHELNYIPFYYVFGSVGK